MDERSVDRPLVLSTFVIGGRFNRSRYTAWGHFVDRPDS